MNHALETRLARAARALDTTALPRLLAELEGADWALLLPSEAALFTTLARLVPHRVLRPDPRFPLDEIASRRAGFAPATIDADWRESVVLLADPDERQVKRARKAEAVLVADATFSPGSGVLARGATFVAYRGAGTLIGHPDVRFAALFGLGEQPDVPHAGVDVLTASLILRDLPTLHARLARQASAAQALAERLGERASSVSGALLLVTGDVPATTLFEPGDLGGARSARQEVEGGTLLSVGLEAVEDLWRDLTGDAMASEVKVADEPSGETLVPEAAEVQAEETPEAAAPEETPEAAAPEETPEVAAPDETPVEEDAERPAEEPAEPEATLMPDLPSAPDVRGESADPAEDLSPEERAVYERLREWRNAEARRQEVSRFIVASNATLAQIARALPQTEEELRAVRGMGPERVRRYAEPILNMLRGMR